MREVRNVVERALLLCDGPEILPEHLPIETHGGQFDLVRGAGAGGRRRRRPRRAGAEPGRLSPPAGGPPRPAGVVDEEKERILRVLAEHGGNQTQAAKALGIARSTLIARLESYGVPRPRKPGEAGRARRPTSPIADRPYKLSDGRTT